MALDEADLESIFIERASVYRLLARLVDREIDADAAKLVYGIEAACGLDAQGDSVEHRWACAVETMRDEVRGFDEDVRKRLAADFAHTFLAAGIYEGDIAVPYESIYTSEERLLMQDARDEVRAWYRKAGIMPTTKGDIPEDYLPYECQFMASLNEKAAAALRDGDDEQAARLANEQAEFFQAHIANWVDDLVADIAKVARTPFYRAVGEMLSVFVECEREDAVGVAHRAEQVRNESAA